MSTIRVLPERDMWLPGEVVRGTVELHADKPLRARGVRLRLRGFEETQVSHGSGKSRHTHREHVDLIDHEITFAGEERITDVLEGLSDGVRALFGGGEYLQIPAGERTFEFEVELPADLRVSYEGQNANVKYEMTGYVDVPGGVDVRDARQLYLLAPPVGKTSREPCVGHYPDAAASWGPFEILRAAFAPNIRMRTELVRGQYLVGEAIEGRLTVWNQSEAAIRRVEVTLISLEEARAGHASSKNTEEHGRFEGPAPVLRDFSADFRLQVPSNAHPSTAASFFTYNWAVKVRLDIPWQFDVVSIVPIVVFAAAGA